MKARASMARIKTFSTETTQMVASAASKTGQDPSAWAERVLRREAAVALGKGPVRVGSLRTIGQVCTELGRLYRAARRGDLGTDDAARLGHILNILRQGIEVGSLESRLQRLEEEIDA